MFCTSCQIEITDKAHYLQDLHTLNTQRKVHNIPPLQELPQDYTKKTGETGYGCKVIAATSCTTNNATKRLDKLQINETHTPVFCLVCDRQYSSEEELDAHFYTHKPILTCYACDTTYNDVDEIQEHIATHDIDYEMYFIAVHRRTCMFCSVVVKDEYNYKTHIKKHFAQQLNVDGAYATLENGRVIGKKEYMRYFSQTLRKVETKQNYAIQQQETTKKEAKIRNEHKKNDVKVSLAMNAQKYFRAHWLQ